MKRTNTTDAITTTSVILFVIAVIIGDPTDTGIDWIIRAICVYPFTHLAWRAYRHQQHPQPPREK